MILKTSKGEITIELDEKAAPITVKNFLSYVEDGFYDGMEVLDAIEIVQTGNKMGHGDVPVEDVTILSAKKV